MDKPTEHQPLDDLFRRKLNQASVQPGTESWSRLQGRLAGQQSVLAERPSRRIGAIWYGSASAVAACMLLAFLWTNWNEKSASNNLGNELSAGEKAAKTRLQPLENRVIPSPTGGLNEVSEAVVTQPKTSDSPKNQLKPEKQHSGYAKRFKVEKREGVITVNPQRQIVKAIEKKTEPTLNKPEVPEKNELASTSPQNGPTKPAVSNPERTLIVSVAEPISEQTLPTVNEGQPIKSAVAQTPVKNARIARVFRQIKRLKDGEVLARADVSTNETDDESGLVNRLFQSARSKENQSKQQK